MSGYVYLAEQDGIHKIGASYQPHRRTLTVAPSGTLVHIIESDNYFQVEKALHRRFGELALGKEWFALTEDDVEAFCRVARADTVDDLPVDLQPPPKPTMRTIKLDPELMRMARTIAAIRQIRVGAYLDSILRPTVTRDYRSLVRVIEGEVIAEADDA